MDPLSRAESHRVDKTAVDALQGLMKFIEVAVLHIDDIVDLADVVDKMGVAIGDETELFEISILLKKVVLGDELVDFESVGTKVRRDETELAGEGGGPFVDMGGDEKAADAVYHFIDAVDIDIDSVEQMVFFFTHNLLILVDDELVAEAVLVVGDRR